MKQSILFALATLPIIFSPVNSAADGSRIRSRQVIRQRQSSCNKIVERVVVEEVPEYAEVYYFVGQPLRIQALMELEKEADYAEYLRWKSNSISKQAVTGDKECPTCPPAEPTPPTNNSDTSVNINPGTKIIEQTCAKCHSGATPKAQLTITNDAHLDLDTFKKARNMVLSGKMPKGTKLSEAEKDRVLVELSLLLGE